MANIDDILQNKLVYKKEIDYLKKMGVNELTNKAAIIQALVDAAKSGDVKAALYLLENSTQEKSQKAKETPIDKARKRVNGKKKT